VAWPEFRPSAILAALVSDGVDFVVVGGYAAIAHGSAQITRDLDLCYARSPDNLDALGRALIRLNARLRGVVEDVPFIPDGRTLRRTAILTLDTNHGWLDLVAAPAGAPRYDALRRRAEVVELVGLPVPIASLEDLVAMKQAAGRPKDLVALEELEVIARLRRGQQS
jgi:hypothetical protein